MKQTPLYELHKKLGAKMVEFGGWLMPVSYSGVLKEHQAVREKMGLFDVSHMGEVFIEGDEAFDFLQQITCNDVGLLKPGKGQYTLFTRPNGGVVDDVLLYQLDDKKYFFCVNASNIEKDTQWLLENKNNFKVKIENKSNDYGLIALQGPLASQLLQKLTSFDLTQLKTFHLTHTQVADLNVMISRTGYTGEDGFEIFVSSKDAPKLWEQLIEIGKPLGLIPCGLGCRDTLRLEMAYPLYGHELNDEITPLEADLNWVVKLNKGNFLGREVLIEQKEKGLQKKRVGFVMKEKGIARENYPIFHEDKKIGSVCSGTYSPSLDKNIGCGYVPVTFAKIGSIFQIEIRDKKLTAEVVATPFYKRSI